MKIFDFMGEVRSRPRRWVVAVVALIGVRMAALERPQATPDRLRCTRSVGVRYLPNDQVQAAFAKGAPMIETDTYKVLASRRDRDGQAEVHARDTDIMYVLEGTATLVTGGQVVNGKATAADEQRGDSITGGNRGRSSKETWSSSPRACPIFSKT